MIDGIRGEGHAPEALHVYSAVLQSLLDSQVRTEEVSTSRRSADRRPIEVLPMHDESQLGRPRSGRNVAQ